MNAVILNFDQKNGPAGTVRTMHLEMPDGKRHSVFFEFPGETLPEPKVLDAFVIASMQFAMEQEMTLRVRGSVTERLLHNMHEYQSAWHLWQPERYKTVDIEPDRIESRATERMDRRAISAFSGGIDSTFTAWRHGTKQLNNASYPLSDAVLVQGFDIRLDSKKAFTELVARFRPFLETFGIHLHIVRTDLKQSGLLKWEHSFNAQLAACLHQYAHDFRYALLASAEPYDALAIGGGSNPVIDPFLSGEEVTFVHDGAGFPRTRKLEILSQAGIPLEGMKVCWEGKQEEKNCGRCEKCTRTHLALLAVGVTTHPCFAEPLRLEDLSSMILFNDFQFLQLRSVYMHAVQRGFTEQPWAIALKERLDRYKKPNASQTLLMRVRHRARKLLAGN